MLTIRPFVVATVATLVACLFLGARAYAGGVGVGLTKSPNRDVAIGETVTLTATLDDGAQGKQVQFAMNGQPYASATTNSQGKATTTYVPAAAGTANFVASCQGYTNSAQVGVTAVAATVAVTSGTVGVGGSRLFTGTITVDGDPVMGLACGGLAIANPNLASAQWYGPSGSTTDTAGRVYIWVTGSMAGGPTTLTVTGGGGSGQGNVTVATPTISVSSGTVGVGGGRGFSADLTAGGDPVVDLACGGPALGNPNLASAEWYGPSAGTTDMMGRVYIWVTGSAAGGPTTLTVTGGGGSGQGNVTVQTPTITVSSRTVSIAAGGESFSARATAGGDGVIGLVCGGPIIGNPNLAEAAWVGGATTDTGGVCRCLGDGTASGRDDPDG
jgi:hypothetical protein